MKGSSDQIDVSVVAPFEDAGLLRPADRHIASTLARLLGESSPSVILAVALASRAPRHGHVAVDLVNVATTAVAEAMIDPFGQLEGQLDWPEPDRWIAEVSASPLVSVVAHPRIQPNPDAPLVLSGSLLYLQKYWVYEREVARQLRRRSEYVITTEVADRGLGIAAELLTGEGSVEQLRAVRAGLSRGLTVIVGGPGTGKTTTVAALVAEIVNRSVHNHTVSVALAAPTGKAAARLGEAFAAAAAALPLDLGARLQQVEASTIHRLLGASPQSPTVFRYHQGRPLPHDLVIVDEASMISMPLMARLLDAVRLDARCVIVGDSGQLASVEAGSVLADIAASTDESSPDESSPDESSPAVDQYVVRLRHSRRFPDGSPVGLLARAINSGDADAALEVLRDPGASQAHIGGVTWIETSATAYPISDHVTRAMMRELWLPNLKKVRSAAEAGDGSGALDAMMKMQVLCGHRRGPFGVSQWNQLAEQWSCPAAPSASHGSGLANQWYPGKVVMVTANNNQLGLFNGDLGVVIRDQGHTRIAFDGPDGIRLIAPSRLESIEPASAMTIHKSQGSEFDHVVVVLPPAESRLATRELLYTGVTRARNHMALVGSQAALRVAINTRVSRASGLRSLLQ